MCSSADFVFALFWNQRLNLHCLHIFPLRQTLGMIVLGETKPHLGFFRVLCLFQERMCYQECYQESCDIGKCANGRRTSCLLCYFKYQGVEIAQEQKKICGAEKLEFFTWGPWENLGNG